MPKSTYSVYEDDRLLVRGTLTDVARWLGVSPARIYHYASKSNDHKRRYAVRDQGLHSRRYGEYAVYSGDQLRFIGSREDVLDRLGISEETLNYYLTPTYLKRVERRKTSTDALIITLLDDDLVG